MTGDHATATQAAGHSWHPVPVILRGERAGRHEVDRFGERWCGDAALGLRRSTDLMPLALATAGRLAKFGA